MDDTPDSWFKREILPHEAALMRYLRRIGSRKNEIDDLRQETYARVYKAATAGRPQAAKAFLFAAARNLIADRLRRERVVSIEAVEDVDGLNVLIDELTPERRANARQELRRLVCAFDLLPPRCREVVWMRRVQELPQREVAARLGIDQKTVERHVSHGSRLLASYVLSGKRHGVPVRPTDEDSGSEEHEQGKR